MPKKIVEPSIVTLNGFDVACDVEEIDILLGRRPPVLVTGVCDTFEQSLTPNVKKWSVRMNYFINWDSSSTSSSSGGIAVALNSIWNSTQYRGVSFLVRESTAIRSATNPEWSGYVGLDGDFGDKAGAFAEAAKSSVQLMGMGTLSFLTSSS